MEKIEKIPQVPSSEWYNCSDSEMMGRTGHFRYFLNFFSIKKDFFPLFFKLIIYFCTSPI